MTHRRYQLACALTAFVIGVCGTVCARQGLWAPTAVLAFGALFFVELSLREARAHRAATRRAPAPDPCCAAAARFGGAAHTTHCTRKDHAA